VYLKSTFSKYLDNFCQSH